MHKGRRLNPVRLRLEIFTSRAGFGGYDPDALPLARSPETPLAVLDASDGLVIRASKTCRPDSRLPHTEYAGEDSRCHIPRITFEQVGAWVYLSFQPALILTAISAT